MMVRLGNFLFHYRNALFPVAYLLVLAKGHLVTPHYRLATAAGFTLALAGQLLRAVTIGLDYIRRGGRNRQVSADDLVTGGLFAHCRNPLYVGNYFILLGVGVASCSVLFIAVGLPLFALAYWAIIQAEEDFLRRKFGPAFECYCAKVSRLGFNTSGLPATLRSMEFNWRRLITTEYGSTAGWLLGIILVSLHNAWLTQDLRRDNRFVIALTSLGCLVVAAYLLARYLKKSGKLHG